MTHPHTGWQARHTRTCTALNCGATYTPDGPAAKYCPKHQARKTCDRCGASYPSHRAHACKGGMSA